MQEVKDMIYYRDRLNKLLIDASKNRIELEVRRDLDGRLALYFADLITGESCSMRERVGYNARSNKKT